MPVGGWVEGATTAGFFLDGKITVIVDFKTNRPDICSKKRFFELLRIISKVFLLISYKDFPKKTKSSQFVVNIDVSSDQISLGLVNGFTMLKSMYLVSKMVIFQPAMLGFAGGYVTGMWKKLRGWSKKGACIVVTSQNLQVITVF